MGVQKAKNVTKPLIKWPGGKRWLVPKLVSLAPTTYAKYIEPFAGGAALYFALKPKDALLTDVNADLITTYRMVRDEPERVIKRLHQLRNDEEEYYRVRAMKPQSEIGVATRFLYLSRLSFNGIYRRNLKGEFNVPYGHKEHLSACDAGAIRAAHTVLTKTTLVAADFELIIDQAERGDFVYVDPPYTVAHNNNGFVKYNEKIFSWADQERLAISCSRARKRGAFILVSNADHYSIRPLYSEFNILRVQRSCVIAADPAFRRNFTEVLLFGGG